MGDNTNKNILFRDLDHILTHTECLWEGMREKKIFITGGTGFFGCWFLESFLWANEKLALNATITVLTRNKALFAQKCPHLIKSSNKNTLNFLEGDVRNFNFPRESFSYIIHAATEASSALNISNPNLMFDTITQGTKHVLKFAETCKATKFLFVSSGAVYGSQPPDIEKLHENYSTATISQSAYTLGKRQAEQMCIEFSKNSPRGPLWSSHGATACCEVTQIKIARCFAFVGPYLPLNTHFAIGNFIANGLNGETIIVNGDGTPCRSYLYASDLMIWLWTILIKGKNLTPYNVGSDAAINIADLAHTVANCFTPKPEVKIMQIPDMNIPPARYVPDINRARTELNLFPRVNLIDAIHFTKNWFHHSHQQNAAQVGDGCV